MNSISPSLPIVGQINFNVGSTDGWYQCDIDNESQTITFTGFQTGALLKEKTTLDTYIGAGYRVVGDFPELEEYIAYRRSKIKPTREEVARKTAEIIA